MKGREIIEKFNALKEQEKNAREEMLKSMEKCGRYDIQMWTLVGVQKEIQALMESNFEVKE